jgi:hypothetical protein
MASNQNFTSIFNFTKQVAGFTMPSTTPMDADPNKNPADNFKPISDFVLKGSTTILTSGTTPVYCLFDHSASNAECVGLMKMIANAIQAAGNSNTNIIPFGSDYAGHFSMFPVANYHPIRGNCNWATYAVLIREFFSFMAQTTPYNLVFLGDGEFNAPILKMSFQNVINDAARAGTLDRCQQLTILFSPHTSERTMATLTAEVTQICAQTRNVIPIQCHRLNNRNLLTPQDNRVINQIGKIDSVKLPASFIHVGDWAIHENLNMQSLVSILKGNKPAADSILTLIQTNAGINPGLLISHKMYGLLYRTLCHQDLFGKEMNGWMNRLLTDKATSAENRKILQQLIDNSRAAAAKDALTVKLANLQERGLIIGFQKCSDGAINPDEVRHALKEMNFAALIRMAQTLVKTAHHNLIPVKDVRPGDIIGMPILNTKNATQNECLEALKLMFCQFGEDLFVNGVMLYTTALGMLFTDTQVSKPLHQQIERALFDNIYATMINLGISRNPTTDAWEWNEDTHARISAPAVCGLLSRAFTHFGERMFPGVDISNPAADHVVVAAAYQEVIGTARAYTINRFLSTVCGTNLAFQVTGKFNFGLFPGKSIFWTDFVICAFKPFTKDPQPNLPSMGYTINRVGDTRHQLEYLDRPLGTGDTVTLGTNNLIPLFDLSGMPAREHEFVLTQVNLWLNQMQIDGALGHLGPKMLMNTNQTPEKGRLSEYPVPDTHITRDQELYDTNMRAAIDKICELISTIGKNPKDYQIGGYTPIARPLTRTEAVAIISDMAALTPEAAKIYTRGNNLNAANLAVVKARLPGQTQKTPEGIPPALIKSVRETFTKMMVPAPLAHLQVGTTNTCCCCIDTLANRHMVKLACTHDLCETCNDAMTGYQPSFGEPVNLAMCRCPTCRTTLLLHNQLLLAALQLPELIGNEHSVLLRCRIPECPAPYYCEELTCGATADTLPKLCLKHRPKEEQIKVTTCPNPNCSASITRSSGCDVVRCQCHQALCFGCGAALPSTTIHWDCHGSLEACQAAVAHRATHPGTDPENWSDAEETQWSAGEGEEW